jgi:uncharacterized protein with von Willebrand factor type A (vWA) domain
MTSSKAGRLYSELGTQNSELVVYSRWDGARACAEPDAEALLAALAGELLDHGDVERALAGLARRGLPGPEGSPGLDALHEWAQAALRQALALLEADDEGEMEAAERALVAARAALDALVAQLAGARAGGDVARVDADLVGELLGLEARGALERVQRLALTLTDGGYAQLIEGRLTLTRRAARRLGQRALHDLYARLRPDRAGQHAGGERGAGGEPGETSAPYHFGEAFLLDVQATLRRALAREGVGTPLGLAAGDFAVFRTEPRVRSATVLLLDVSRSMLLRGCFTAAKQVALALQALIEQRFRGDHLDIVTFAHGARVMPSGALPRLRIDEREYGTNLHAALRLARTLLRRRPDSNKQIVVITDGEPTAHQRDEGGVFFAYPPTPRTIEATLREVIRCTEERIVINAFMLERGQHLTEFVAQMSRLNRGRSFFVTPERLGEYVLVDYAARHRRLARR